MAGLVPANSSPLWHFSANRQETARHDSGLLDP